LKRDTSNPVIEAWRQVAPFDRLTDRQCDVVKSVLAGLTNQEIAGQLGVAPRTIDKHMHDVYGRLDIYPASTSRRVRVAVMAALAMVETAGVDGAVLQLREIQHA